MPMVGTSTEWVISRGHLVGDALEHDGEAAGGGQGLGVGHQLERRAVLAALDLEAAHGVHRLRGEAEVAHHGDLGVDEGLDHRQALAPALELHGLGAGPDELGAVADRLDRGRVVAHPRQVGDDQRLGAVVARRGRAQAAGDGTGVVGQVVDRDLERVLVAEHDHGHRVAHQDQVDPGLVGHAGTRGVVGRDHDERAAVVRQLAGSDRRRGDLRAHCCTSYRPAPEWLPAAPTAYADAARRSNRAARPVRRVAVACVRGGRRALRQLRERRGRGGGRPPDLRHPRGVGHRGQGRGGRRGRALVLPVPDQLSPRGRRPS